MNFYRFWGPPGEPTGVQRTMFSGSENTLGTKWPQGPPKGLPRVPKALKINRKHALSSNLYGVLTSLVMLLLHAIPWQRSKHHKTKEKLR